MSRFLRGVGILVLLGFEALSRPLAGETGEDFHLEVRSPVLVGSPLHLTVRPQGVAEDRSLSLLVILDGETVGRFATPGGPTRLRLDLPALSAGVHRLEVKSGTLRGTIEFEVWPRWKLWALLASPLLLFLLAIVLFRLSRKTRPLVP